MTRTTADDYHIHFGSGDDLQRVEAMWLALYEHQHISGMLLELPADAFQCWATSLKPLLGRFACLFIAELSGDVAGFLAGRIRSLPPHFGSIHSGFISEVYIAEEHRQHGLGSRLVSIAMDWFQSQRVQRIELQVLMDNTPARRLYQQLGWREELVQMVWQAEPESAK